MSNWEDKLDPSNYEIGEEVKVFPPAGHPILYKIEKFSWDKEKDIHICHVVNECDKAREPSGEYRDSYPFVERYFEKNKKTLAEEGERIVGRKNTEL